MVEGFLDGLRKEAVADYAPADGHPAFSAPAPGRLSHQLAQYVYDADRRERRPGNREDYIELLKLGEVLHPEEGVGHCLLLTDAPAPVEPLEATLLQVEYASRPKGAYVQDMRQMDYLREMEEIAGTEGWRWLANVGFSSPLRLGRDIAERFAFRARRGDPSDLYIMTVSGAGLPVTAAGCTVVAAAEFLANWMAARALNPSIRLRGGAWIATMDMKAGEASYSAPDAAIRNFLLREFLLRWTGIEIGVGGGEYTPAKVPGLYAALEKACSAMTVAAFTGRHPGVGSGHLDGGLTISPDQLLLDREMAAALRHLERPVDLGPEAIGLDAILEVGHGAAGNYMTSRHTLRHFRSSLWLPELMDRAGWAGPASEDRVLERTRAKRRALLATYAKPPVDPGLLDRLRKVVVRARSEIG
jgi:trimethylamine--corrinoid protein Co-methyltransferase